MLPSAEQLSSSSPEKRGRDEGCAGSRGLSVALYLDTYNLETNRT